MQAIVIPTIGPVADSLRVSRLAGTWVLTAYLLSGAVTTPLVGRLGDLFGNRRVLIWVLWITAAGGVLSACSTAFALVVLGRILAGTCTATMPLGYGIMREHLPNARLGPMVALVAVSIAVGTGIGNVLAGTVQHGLGTQWLFGLPLLLTLPTCVMAQLWVPNSLGRERGRVNWSSAIAMAVSLLSLLIAVSESTTWGWQSPRTLGLLAFGAVALVGWVLVELAAEQPLIDMRLMALPGVWRTNVTSLLFGFGMFAAFTVVPQFAETPRSSGYGFGASVTIASLILVTATVTATVGGPLSGRLERSYGAKVPLVVGGLIGLCGYLLICLLNTHIAALFVAFALLGVGMGVGYAVLPHVIVLAVPREHTGGATGINVIARNIGGAIGIQLGATVLAAHLAPGTALPSRSGYLVTFWLLAAAGAGATIGSLTIPTRRRLSAAASTAVS